MADDNEQPKDAESTREGVMDFAWFLKNHPVNSSQEVVGFWERHLGRLMAPTLRLYCSECQGVRNFKGAWNYSEDIYRDDNYVTDFLEYKCKDCELTHKSYALIARAHGDIFATVIKVGEFPEQYFDLPPSVEKLLGKDYTFFTKGLKCEKQGLGIGAFTYYRRVVDSQKDHLIGEILRVAKKLCASPENIAKIEAARKQNSFDRAVETIKDAIPESLLVNGHNPLTLLNGALSSGLHAESDEDCLSIAHSIRLVLVDLSKRLKAALGEQSKLKSAISDLMKFSSKSKKKAKGDGDQEVPS